MLVLILFLALLEGNSLGDREEERVLYSSITEGNISVLDSFLYVVGPDYKFSFYNGYFNPSLLHVAVKCGNIRVVDFLIKRGADINITDKNNQTPLFYAAKDSNLINVFIYLLNNGADFTLKDTYGNNVLHTMVDAGNFRGVLVFLSSVSKFNWDTFNLEGYTPLYMAIRNKRDDLAVLLMENGASVSISNDVGMTPFMLSIKMGDYPIFVYMLKKFKGISDAINNGDRYGKTALHYAAMQEDSSFLIKILQFNPECKRDSNGLSPIDYAWKHRHYWSVDFILYHSDSTVKNEYAWVPLFSSFFDDDTDKVSHLINDFDVAWKDKYGRTGLHIASLHGSGYSVKALLLNGADPNIADMDGNTPLHYAVLQGNYDIIKKLILAGAKPNIKNKYGKSPLDIARQKNDVFAIALLNKK